MRKRLFAGFLAIIMLMGLLPSTALAAPGDEGLPIYFFICEPGTEPDPTNGSYASYPGYTQGSATATAAASSITSAGIRNVTDEDVIFDYIASMPNNISMAEFEDFGENTAFTFSTGWGGGRTARYSSSQYDVVWVAISQKAGYNASDSSKQCNCQNMRNIPHIHIDGVLSRKVTVPDDLALAKSIPAAQTQSETFTFKLEKLMQDADYDPIDQVDPNFEPIELTATIPAGETSAKLVGSSKVTGAFGYYRVTEVDNPKWEPSHTVYISVATNGTIRYSNNLQNFTTSTALGTISNKYQTYTVTYEDGLSNVNAFNNQVYSGLQYGVSTPGFTGNTPMYPDGTMAFAGWSPAVADTVTGDATYTATWKDNAYTVTWKDEDGSVLETDEDVVDGTMPTYNKAEPTKAADAQYTYQFAGWTPEIAEVNGADQTYTAVYTATPREYTVTWLDEDSSELHEHQVPYGTVPTYAGSKTTAQLAQEKSDNDPAATYTFIGWTPSVVEVTGDATYTATYNRTTDQYTVRFLNYNDYPLYTKTEDYGEYVAYQGSTPERPGDASFYYTFAGWDDLATAQEEKYAQAQAMEVTGNRTFKAVYDQTPAVHTGTVRIYLDGAFDTATQTASGTSKDIGDMMGVEDAIYLKAQDPSVLPAGSPEYFKLDRISVGVYQNKVLPNAAYHLYVKNGADYEQLDKQLLTINQADRTRYVFFNSVNYYEDAPARGTPDRVEYYHEDTGNIYVYSTAPTKANHRFDGWKYDGNLYQPGQLLVGEETISGRIDLVGQWTENKVTVNVKVILDHAADTDNDGVDDTYAQEADTLVIGLTHCPDGSSTYHQEIGYSRDIRNTVWNGGETIADPLTKSEYSMHYSDLAVDGDYSAVASTAGYKLISIHTDGPVTEQDGDKIYTVTIELEYDPQGFELEFSVETEGIPEKFIPKEVDLKVTKWNGSEWEPLDEFKNDTIAVALSNAGSGIGKHHVLGYDHGDRNYYRVEAVDLDFGGGNIISLMEDTEDVSYKSADGVFQAAVNVANGDKPQSNAALSGAYAVQGAASVDQQGDITVTLTMAYQTVIFDPNGGTLLGSADKHTEYVIDKAIPDLRNFVPARDGFTFGGWYYENYPNTKAESGDSLNVSVTTLVAKWKPPFTVEGNIEVDLNHHTGQMPASVVVMLQKLGASGYYDTERQTTESINQDGEGSYKFENVPDDGMYRVMVLGRHSYTEKFRNENDPVNWKTIAEGENYKAVDIEPDGTAHVHIQLLYDPELFDLQYAIDASAIGSGFRPEDADVRLWFHNGTNWTPYNSDETDVSNADINGADGLGGDCFEDVVKFHPSGSAYDYAVYFRAYTPAGGQKQLYDETTALFDLFYEGPANYTDTATGTGSCTHVSPHDFEQDVLLKIILTPKTYPITYYLEENTSVQLRGGIPSAHTWSYQTDLKDGHGNWKFQPRRDGFVFTGWVDEQGNPVSIIEDGTAVATKLFATWEVDNWKDADETDDNDDKDSPIGGDGIPDSQQVHIRYITDGNGTVSPVGEIVTIAGTGFADVSVTTASGSTAVPASGFVLDRWTYADNQEDNNEQAVFDADAAAICPTIHNANGGQSYEFHAEFTQDYKGNEQTGGSDGIPDKYQAFVEFRSENVNRGTVDGRIRQTFNFGNGVISGIVTPSLDDVEVRVIGEYAFDHWIKDDETDNKLTDEQVEMGFSGEGGKTYTFTANFEIDEWTDGDQTPDPDDDDTDEKGDGIPDYKQVMVEFVPTANGRGTVTGEGAVQVFTLAETNGSFTGSVTPVNNEQTPVTVTPNTGFAFDYWGDTDGFWGEAAEPVENPFVEHQNVVGGQIIVYTAHFWVDNWKDGDEDPQNPQPDSPTGGDGIADNYQLMTEYLSENEAYGTVSPEIEIISLQGKDAEDITLAGATAKAKENYKFESWHFVQRAAAVDYDQTKLTIRPVVRGAQGGEHYIFIAGFAENTVPPVTPTPDPEPDPEPDPGPEYNTLTYYDGSDVLDRDSYAENVRVTLNDGCAPDKPGYAFKGWKDENGEMVDWVKMYSDRKVYAVWERDVSDPDNTGVSERLETDDHIQYLFGYPDGSFGPQRNMTRAEAAQMFFNLLRDKTVYKTTTFTDVKGDEWFADAVHTMAHMGVISGYPGNLFMPNKPITRAEFTTMAMQFTRLDQTGSASFSDVSLGDWFYTFVVGASKYGWISGYPDGTFKPNAQITRAEVTSIVNNMLGRFPDREYIDDADNDIHEFIDLEKRYWAYYPIMEATNGHDYTKHVQSESWHNNWYR